MSSVVKMGSALYLKVDSSLARAQMDELEEIQTAFERSGDEDFVFDLSSLQSVSTKALVLLMTMQKEARRKGKVYVLTPHNGMREELLKMEAIKLCEVYENRGLIGQALKERSKGHIPAA